MITMLYVDLHGRVAFPLVASVPLCAVTRYCEAESVWSVVKYFKKTLRSPLKSKIVPLVGRNEYTRFVPLLP